MKIWLLIAFSMNSVITNNSVRYSIDTFTFHEKSRCEKNIANVEEQLKKEFEIVKVSCEEKEILMGK